MPKKQQPLNVLPPLAQFVLDGYYRKGVADAKAGSQPKPPLRDDSCAAYWNGYRAKPEKKAK